MIKIGSINLNTKVLCAPMCGITDLPFRKIINSISSDILTFSEMIAQDAAIYEKEKTMKRALHHSNPESDSQIIYGIQIAGYCPEKVSKAIEVSLNLFDDSTLKIIDLNFGCPVKKVVNNYSGSALLKDLNRMKEIISSAYKTCQKFDLKNKNSEIIGKVPLSIKTRIGWDHSNLNSLDVIKMAEDEGVSMMSVHGRTRSQMFSGNADWEFISKIKEASKNIPIIVNGDIKDGFDAIKALYLSKADGIMIGRGVQGKPWILKQINDFILKNQDILLKDCDQIDFYNKEIYDFDFDNGEEIMKYGFGYKKKEDKFEIIKQHLHEIINHYGDISSVGFMKKHLGWYLKGYNDSSNFRGKINSINNNLELIKEFEEFFLRLQ